MIKIKNTKQLVNEILPIIDKINSYTFKKKNELLNREPNSKAELLDIYLFAQYIERYSIEIRFLINQYSLSTDFLTTAALQDPDTLQNILKNFKDLIDKSDKSDNSDNSDLIIKSNINTDDDVPCPF